MATEKIPPTHPGEILRQEFLEPSGLSPRELAEDLDVGPRRISEILGGRRAVTADMALRLARFFDMAPGFWLGLQRQYELDVAEDALEGRL